MAAGVEAPQGSTVAAALALAGVAFNRRSVSGQPRAPLCGMGVCRECVVSIDGAQQLACQVACSDGLEVRTGSSARSSAGLSAELGTEVSAAVRPAAGTSVAVGRHATAPPANPVADLLIAGAGPAGLAAALAAAPSGARIVVFDDNPHPGGQVWRSGAAAMPPAGRRRIDALARHSNVTVLSGARVLAAEVTGAGLALLVGHEADSVWWQAPKLVIASGARERFVPFPGWTLPGVTGAGGLQALIKGGLPVAGQRVVVAGSGPLLLAAAATAAAAGAQVLRVAEQAAWVDVARFAAGLWRWPGKAWQALRLRPAAYRTSSWVVQALGDDGERLLGVRLHETGRGGRTTELQCDRLACGFGLVPNTELAERLGCSIAGGAVVVDARQATSVPGVFAAGECAGIGGADAALIQGTIAGHAAVGEHAAARRLAARRRRAAAFSASLARHFALREELRALPQASTLVCRCEDVPHGALRGHAAWTEAKLATRCGMGPCQGRVCGVAAKFLYGWEGPRAGWVLAPVSVGALALSRPDPRLVIE